VTQGRDAEPIQPSAEPKGRYRRVSKAILTLCGAGLLAGMIVWIGPATLIKHLAHVDPVDLIGAAAAIVAGTLLGAINSYLICGAARFIDVGGYLRAFWIAWAVGLVLPGQVGDMLTLTQVLRRRGMPLSLAVARTSVDKIVSLICSLAVASQLFRLGDSVALRTLSAAAVLLLVGVVVSIALSVWLFHRIGKFELKNRWVLGMVAAAAEVARTARERPGILALNAVLSIAKIGLTGVSYWLVLAGLVAVPPPLPKVTIAAISSGLVAYLPLSANGIGTVEAAATGLFAQIGIGLAIVVSMYVLLRLLNILLAWIPASLFFPHLLHHLRTQSGTR
jgi:uncharacterized membrane protein YbhN (UPF0104 family)